MSVWAIVVAAGGGTRFGGPKQFANVRDRPMVDWSVAAARPAVDGVVLVLPADDAHLSSGDTRGADVVVAGGETRSDSVRSGLRQVPEDAEVVVVHDGARPLATAGLFKVVVETVLAGADAVVPAVAPSDTLKRIVGDVVTGTISREDVVAVQTPQGFRADILRAAHAGGANATDDSSLVEALGATVRLVPGDPRNVKVTTPADLELVQALAST